MKNITPSTPSYVFGYWRPWKENSNAVDSYLDYAKDVSLAKYSADVVGNYINEASEEQVIAINELGQAIGRGINVLSNQLTDINENLVFLNRNIDILKEQQKLSNLLLQNISQLLRVPDNEKERQHCIELGIKFFVNGSKDSDLYSDALEEFLKAETFMKQDYFVLHRIGCIYLYIEKYINVEKALDYFLRAAKYASVESDPSAMRLINVLNGELSENLIDDSQNHFNVILKSAGESKLMVVKVLTELTDLGLKEAKELVDAVPTSVKEGVSKDEVELIKKELEKVGAEVSIVNKEKAIKNDRKLNNNLARIEQLAADSYEKGAFASYVLGRFDDAVNYQTKALKLKPTSENRFILSKYQLRNNNISDAIGNLDLCINEEPIYAIAAFKELDLINEPEVVNLISNKNNLVNKNINRLIEKLSSFASAHSQKIINELSELLKKSYEFKVGYLYTLYKELGHFYNKFEKHFSKIDSLIKEINNHKFKTFDENKINDYIKDLEDVKGYSFDQMLESYDRIKDEIETDILKIGSQYAGGIVFYLDQTGKHGLVFSMENFEQAVWAVENEHDYTITNNCNGIADGVGMSNTKKIVELASWHIEKGFFSTTKKPAVTAARLCLESNFNGYNDWYLPTKDELKLIYLNKNMYDQVEIHNGCWSSTQDNDGNVWSQYKDIELLKPMSNFYNHAKNNFISIRKF